MQSESYRWSKFTLRRTDHLYLVAIVDKENGEKQCKRRGRKDELEKKTWTENENPDQLKGCTLLQQLKIVKKKRGNKIWPISPKSHHHKERWLS